MITLRHRDERGIADHGWLQSRHSFSFGNYYDPKHMGVSALRVINDDKVTPGNGFATHSHQNMEIISYVKQGAIEHKDSMGNVEILPAGEFQLMSAGTGITHSEYNPSATDPLEFLQIWVMPNVENITPMYQQKKFDKRLGLQLIASPDGRDGSLHIHQDACLYQLCLEASQTTSVSIEPERRLYIHLVSGSITLDGESLKAGDGATVADQSEVRFMANERSEALLFDLP